jgi:hypothetical protein
MYQLWQARMQRDAARIEDTDKTAKRVLYLVDWQSTRSAASPRSEPWAEHWLPPAVGWVKANTDGAFRYEQGYGGGGVFLRDHHGGFIFVACHFFPLSNRSGEGRIAGLSSQSGISVKL